MVDFGNHDEVQAWLETRSREEIAVFAARAAARVFPVLVGGIRWSKSNLDLICARAILTAGLRGVYPTPAVRDAASSASAAASVSASAAFGASAAASSASDAAFASAFAADASAIAAASASAAAASAAFASFAAADADAASFDEVAAERVMGQALWQDDEPGMIAQDWQDMKDVRSKDHRIWGFWIDWYDGLLEGRPIDWDLWHDVALIPDDVWDEGPEAVARAIAEIKAKRLPPLSDAQVTAQAQRLIARPQTTSLVGHDVANKIEAAIADYMMVEKANCLPEAFQVLHALPALLRGMAETSQSADRIAELEKQIVALVGETVRLSKDVEALRAAAKAPKGKSLGGVFVEQSVKASATILTTGFFGTLAMGISHFTSVVDFGSALEVVSDFGKDVDEIVPTLPPATDV